MSAIATGCGYFQNTASESFRSSFDKTPFSFSHTLREANIFTWPKLWDLAGRAHARSAGYYFESGDTTPGESWRGVPNDRDLLDVMEHIGESNSLIMLKRVQEYEEYAVFLQTCIDELNQLCGIDFRRLYRDPVMTVLITSPNRVTPYHIDGEANFLFQLEGSKIIHIFNGADSTVLSDRELEDFWSGADARAARYRAEFQEQAWHFHLSPGTGVSNPVIFPHWVQNDDNVSVSMSLNFKRVVDKIADAYRINHALRKIGLHPVHPGNLPVLDGIKSSGYRAARSLKRHLPH